MVFIKQKKEMSYPTNKKAFNPQIQQELTREQQILQELLGGGERTWGTGQNLPKLNRQLTSGNGLIKSGDYTKETASLFGFRRY